MASNFQYYQDIIWQVPIVSITSPSGAVCYSSVGDLHAYRQQVLKDRRELDEYDELDQQDESEEANGR